MQTGDAPNTVLQDRPAAISNQRLARFTFSAEGTVTDFKCAVDGGADVRCNSPFELEVGDGEHTITVTAFNGAAGDDTPESYAWRVDATPPDTMILTGPSSFDNATTVEITFTGSPPGDVTSFECSLDMAAFAACTSPQSYSDLVSGDHSIRVRAIDAAGNPDATPAIRSWTLDTSTPDTLITSGPEDGSTSGASVQFEFSSPDTTAVFECKFDSGVFSACSSPTSYTNLATGTHTFTVAAKNSISGALDPTPEIRTWTVDSALPTVTIDTAPVDPTNDATPTFTFSSPDTDIALFECSLDAVPFSACTSPFQGGSLADGTHTFVVRVTDTVGNTATDSYEWVIDTQAPSVLITGGPNGPTPLSSATFTFSASGSPSSIRCSIDGGTLASCASPITYPGLQDGQHTFLVVVADAAGNMDMETRMFQVITSGPTVTIETGPSGPTNMNPPTFTFTTTNATQIDCRLDGGAFAACTSPFTPSSPLSQGLHSFEVRVRDAAANEDSDSRSFTVDTLNPTVTIQTGPNGDTNMARPTFTFLVGGSPITTQCRFDMAAFTSCSSPFTAAANLAAGTHTFEVRVTDAAGNSAFDTRTFRVVLVGPTVMITAGPSGATSDTVGSPGTELEFAL